LSKEDPQGDRWRKGDFAPEPKSLFVRFHTKEGPKVKDLSNSSPPCLRQTASCSHNHPLLLVDGGLVPFMHETISERHYIVSQ